MNKQNSSFWKLKIMQYLESHCTGRNHAINAERLAFELGMIEKRMLRQLIHELRESGECILSVSQKPGGYFMPADPSEIEAGTREFVSRTIELRKAGKGIRQGLERRFGNQLKLPVDLGA